MSLSSQKSTNSDIQVRLREIIGTERGDQAQIARRLGESPQRISRYILGETIPKIDFLERLHDILGININWLLTGEGLKYVPKDPVEITLQALSQIPDRETAEAVHWWLSGIPFEPAQFQVFLRDYEKAREEEGDKSAEETERQWRARIKAGWAIVKKLKKEHPELFDPSRLRGSRGLIEALKPRRIPILGRVPAGREGAQRWSEYDAKDFLETIFENDDPDLIALRVEGQSMYPSLMPEDYVLMTPNAKWGTGDLVVVEVSSWQEDYSVKRLGKHRRQEITLISDNFLHFEPRTLPAGEVDIRGKVVGIYRTPSRSLQMHGSEGLLEFYQSSQAREIMEELPNLTEETRAIVIDHIRALAKAKL